MTYEIVLMDEAEIDAARLKRNEPHAYKKLIKLLKELEKHPTTGTGHPEQLRGDRSGQWSRHITDKHRLIYLIDNDTITVLVISAFGHYDDK